MKNKTIVCSFLKIQTVLNGTISNSLSMGCFNGDGTLDMAIGYTLISFITQQIPEDDAE